MWRIREEKEPLNKLVKQGSVSEDIMGNILYAEKELEMDIKEFFILIKASIRSRSIQTWLERNYFSRSSTVVEYPKNTRT